jgi:RNA polymerase sigma-70 factor (ECF subfamily)
VKWDIGSVSHLDDASGSTFVHRIFLKALGATLSRSTEVAEAPEDLENALAAHLDVAKTAWPGVALDPVEFVVYVGARLEAHASLADAVEKIGRLHLGDLTLACACAKGDRSAVGAFEGLLADLSPHLRKVCSADDADEVRQILRERMLVRAGDDDGPRILKYGGRGPLAGWLRVSAVRAARDLKRGRGALPAIEASDALDLSDGGPPLDPELAVIKARYGQHFRAVLREVLAQLPDREKNILAMSVIEGLSTDAIGALYRVNGSTVRRWLAQARTLVLDEVRSKLRSTLNLPATELDSLMGVVRSQLDLNVSQLLVVRYDRR